MQTNLQRQKANQQLPEKRGPVKHKKEGYIGHKETLGVIDTHYFDCGDISEDYTFVKTDQIVQFKYVQFMICHQKC